MALLDKVKQLLPGREGSTLDRKFAITGTFLMISIAIVAIMVYLNSQQNEETEEQVALVLEQQLISQLIAHDALAVVSGNMTVIKRLASNQSRYNQIALILDNGDNEKGIPPLSEEYSVKYAAVKRLWSNYEKNINTIVAEKSSIETINDHVSEINESLPQLISLSNQIVSDLIVTGAPGKNIALAKSTGSD